MFWEAVRFKGTTMGSAMDVKEAIATAKSYVEDIYSSGGESISNLGLEEVEYDPAAERWLVTLAFSRPWSTPKTRAAEVLESLGAAAAAQRRSYKVLTVEDGGRVLSMKSKARPAVE